MENNYNTLIIEETTEEIIEKVPSFTIEIINLIKSVLSGIINSLNDIKFTIGDVDITFLQLFCYSAFFIIGIRIIASILWEHE